MSTKLKFIKKQHVCRHGQAIVGPCRRDKAEDLKDKLAGRLNATNKRVANSRGKDEVEGCFLVFNYEFYGYEKCPADVRRVIMEGIKKASTYGQIRLPDCERTLTGKYPAKYYGKDDYTKERILEKSGGAWLTADEAAELNGTVQTEIDVPINLSDDLQKAAMGLQLAASKSWEWLDEQLSATPRSFTLV